MREKRIRIEPVNHCRRNGRSAWGYIHLPSDEAQGGKYFVSSCGDGCNVILRQL